MSTRKVGTALLAVAALLVWLPAQADAQQESFFIEGRGGIGLGLGDVGFITDLGPTFGADIGYWLHDRVAVTIGGDATLLSGADRDVSDDAVEDGTQVFIDVPDMDLYHYTLGLELLVTPRDNPLEVTFGGGIGATTISTDAFPESFVSGLTEAERRGLDANREFSSTELTVDGRLQVGYDVSNRINVFAGTRAYLAFTDRPNTKFFHEAVQEADERGFDTAWDLPIHAGVKIGF